MLTPSYMHRYTLCNLHVLKWHKTTIPHMRTFERLLEAFWNEAFSDNHLQLITIACLFQSLWVSPPRSLHPLQPWDPTTWKRTPQEIRRRCGNRLQSFGREGRLDPVTLLAPEKCNSNHSGRPVWQNHQHDQVPPHSQRMPQGGAGGYLKNKPRIARLYTWLANEDSAVSNIHQWNILVEGSLLDVITRSPKNRIDCRKDKYG